MECSLVKINNVKKYFPLKGGFWGLTVGMLKAVDGVSFSIKGGETLGLVGESGCGKSTLGKCILRLIDSTDGEIVFDDRNITRLKRSELRNLRGQMQIVYQNPLSSLNPSMRVVDIVGRAIDIHTKPLRRDRDKMVVDVLELVGLGKEDLFKFAREFSGGQQQRIAIAKVLSIRPRFIFFDEPTASLDVSIQAQIVNLLLDLKRKLDLTYLFVSHNLALVRQVSEQVGIMYLGKVVEMGERGKLYKSTLHPYTKALFSAIPAYHPNLKRKRILLHGDVPSAIDLPNGCRFYSRCSCRERICNDAEPELIEAEHGHYVACHLYGR